MKLAVIQDLPALYPAFESWWEARGVTPIPPQMMPLLGIVALDDEEPVAAVWMYMDNSISLGFLTWFVTRPGLAPRKAKAVLDHLLNFMTGEAKRLEITHLIASSGPGSLSRYLCRRGFVVAGEAITHHLKAL